MVYKSQKLVKHISFIKEATNTTGLEAQKTSKAYGNWAKAFFSKKDRNTNVQKDMCLDSIWRAV